jgi:tmRNA-binding protein
VSENQHQINNNIHNRIQNNNQQQLILNRTEKRRIEKRESESEFTVVPRRVCFGSFVAGGRRQSEFGIISFDLTLLNEET